MSGLRLGVIGVGQRSALAMSAPASGARVVSCSDTSEEGRLRAEHMFGRDVRIHRDHRDLLTDNIDAVLILTPDHLHAQHVTDALVAGVPVFIEKPLAITVEDCDRLLTIGLRTGTRLYVGHNLRHLPVVRAMRALIEEGVIGTPQAIWCRHFVSHGGDYYFKDWHADRRNTTGLLLQKASHDLDVIHWLSGAASARVVAMGALAVYGDPLKRRIAEPPERVTVGDWFDPDQWPPTTLSELNPVVDVEDISMMLTELDNGVLASYQQCHFTPDYWRNYTVLGDAGRLENFGDGTSGEVADIKVWNSRRSGYRRDADLVTTVEPGNGSHGGADTALLEEFVRFVLDGTATDTSPLGAREAVAAGEAATISLRNGSRPISVTRPDSQLISWFEGNQRR